MGVDLVLKRFFSVQKMFGMDGDVGMMVLNVVM
jgi:hypothetical protein